MSGLARHDSFGCVMLNQFPELCFMDRLNPVKVLLGRRQEFHGLGAPSRKSNEENFPHDTPIFRLSSTNRGSLRTGLSLAYIQNNQVERSSIALSSHAKA